MRSDVGQERCLVIIIAGLEGQEAPIWAYYHFPQLEGRREGWGPSRTPRTISWSKEELTWLNRAWESLGIKIWLRENWD